MRPVPVSAVALAGLTILASAATAGESRSLTERCRAEVVELHQFLEAWSNAELPETDEAFARFGAVLAPSFHLVAPDGSVTGREPIVEAIREAHGRWAAHPGKIRIEELELRQAAGGLALATYEEWHDFGDETRGRLSSVLFGPNDSAPHGLEWLHLHEAWIAEVPRSDG